jgi:DNA ligase-1
MAKQEGVQLAQTYDPAKHMIAGALMSEKLDGEKAIWDGGISRGLPASQVPYANTVKDYRLKNPPIATGLWSRTGKVIHAPNWFLDLLPGFPLDGELWAGRKNWQQLSSIVSQKIPDDRWHMVEYKIYDSPSWEALMKPRTIKVRNEYEYEVTRAALPFAASRSTDPGVKPQWTFEFVLRYLRKRIGDSGQLSLTSQIELPFNHDKSVAQVEAFASEVLNEGGEGVVIHKRNGIGLPERSWDLLKHKPWFDAEGTVIGYTSGKETDKGSKLLGLMGALWLEWQGARFKISGFKECERQFAKPAQTTWAELHPGEWCEEWIENKMFPRGSQVTFKYRELSDDGVPKEARYLRPASED